MSKCYIELNEKPKNCIYCPCFERPGMQRHIRCGVTKNVIESYSSRPVWCPIKDDIDIHKDESVEVVDYLNRSVIRVD